ncbi:asparagine synthase (glutamine-hydrolysing) [Volucribacter psittacicida]|uniref:asparagine synthase (glutamine-hydrolyzing) n=1 Tax=Volucribacter psittacicida TaxID=203482 RepID=A0A4V2PBR5_9PAST|nr:asparagine synthase B [Volucribacter psittacicida]TCJ98505.1 asparagine synthase (glutamine-hydrolysing) [Volucribacter psittacicida]
MCGFIFSSSSETSEQFKRGYDALFHRGPDHQSLVSDQSGIWGFHRLSIMDLSNNGNQPFEHEGVRLLCNGEIYNYPQLKTMLASGYQFHSGSDCEVLIPLYQRLGIEMMMKMLDGEFAIVLWDSQSGDIMAGRDPMGIRPMFYGYDKQTGGIAFASEAKGLVPFCRDVQPFPPGHYYAQGQFVCYNDLADPKRIVEQDVDTIAINLREKLEAAVLKRLNSDAPLGFLLSGGLDSSLVCAIAQRHSDKPIKTFAVGMDTDPIDLKYAKEVADYLGTEHTEVIMTKDEVLSSLEKVIWHLETWDITTIRASMGMYLVCKYIRENTDLKVLLTGEVSDEIFGYKYTDFAPSAMAFQQEAQKRIRELYMYDVLRADRCLAANSLEARVPFSDTDFVDYAMSINPERKMNVYNKGKYLLRRAFEGLDYLPDSILYREKAAFSDAVGHSMVDHLKAYAESKYSDQDLAQAKQKYPHGTPFTKESLLYRDIFEQFYPGQSHWIKDFWMPNKEWEGCNVDDPSARVLGNYGDSGK